MPESPLVHADDHPNDDPCVRFLDRAEAIRDRHLIAAVIDLGRAALEELYGGSWERASDRSAARDEPLSALVERHGERLDWLGLSIDQIRTALRAYRVDRQLPPVSKGKLLPVSLRALAGVAEPEAMVRLANQAATERWTTQQTLDAVAAWREQAGVRSKGGRPPLPGAVKAVRKIVKASVALAPDDVAALDEAGRAEVRVKLVALQAQVAACLAAIDA
jgi:hypothetical protein